MYKEINLKTNLNERNAENQKFIRNVTISTNENLINVRGTNHRLWTATDPEEVILKIGKEEQQIRLHSY